MNEPIRILVADDEDPVRRICQRILTPLGYSLQIASDSEAALALAEQQPFDLLLTDLRMPGEMTGLELAKKVRQRLPAIKVIIMTAFPSVDSAVDSMRLGLADYLVKPFDASELIRRVKSCLAGVDSAK